MHKSRLHQIGVLVLLGVAAASLDAQASTQIQLAFGYECGDRFIVRNDGTEPVLVEYAAAGSRDRSQLHLAAGRSTEIASAQDGNLELWVGGKLVASEPKGNRPCAPSVSTPTSDSLSAREPPAPPPPAAPPAAPQPPDTASAPAPAPPDSTANGGPAAHAPPPPVLVQPPDWYVYPPGPAGSIYPAVWPPHTGFFGGPGTARGGGGIGRTVSRGSSAGGGRH